MRSKVFLVLFVHKKNSSVRPPSTVGKLPGSEEKKYGEIKKVSTFVIGNGSPEAPFLEQAQAIKRESGENPEQSRCCEPHPARSPTTEHVGSRAPDILKICHCFHAKREGDVQCAPR
jgi:hypothetical protein